MPADHARQNVQQRSDGYNKQAGPGVGGNGNAELLSTRRRVANDGVGEHNGGKGRTAIRKFSCIHLAVCNVSNTGNKLISRTAIATAHPSAFSLSPLLYQLPSFAGINAFKGYLPSAAGSSAGNEAAGSGSGAGRKGKLTVAKWVLVDLGDGRGKRYVRFCRDEEWEGTQRQEKNRRRISGG